jgi:hypothetical protein
VKTYPSRKDLRKLIGLSHPSLKLAKVRPKSLLLHPLGKRRRSLNWVLPSPSSLAPTTGREPDPPPIRKQLPSRSLTWPVLNLLSSLSFHLQECLVTARQWLHLWLVKMLLWTWAWWGAALTVNTLAQVGSELPVIKLLDYNKGLKNSKHPLDKLKSLKLPLSLSFRIRLCWIRARLVTKWVHLTQSNLRTQLQALLKLIQSNAQERVLMPIAVQRDLSWNLQTHRLTL